MRYKILKDASLRESMRKYKEKGDEWWMLFDALIRSSSKDDTWPRYEVLRRK